MAWIAGFIVIDTLNNTNSTLDVLSELVLLTTNQPTY